MKSLGNLAALATRPSQLAMTWPVHKESVRGEIKWKVLPRDAAYKYYRLARRYNRELRPEDRHGGRLGSAALRVFEALIYDFLNYASGRLDPAYEQLARAAGLARSTVALALRRLAACGLISWVRRCATEEKDGCFRLRQQTNAYAINPPSRWLGFKPDEGDPPRPHPDTLGAPHRVPEPLEAAAAAAATTGDRREVLSALALGGDDPLTRALLSLGRFMDSAGAIETVEPSTKSDNRTVTGSTLKI